MDTPKTTPRTKPLPTFVWSRKTGDKFRVIAQYGRFVKVVPMNRKTALVVPMNQVATEPPKRT